MWEDAPMSLNHSPWLLDGYCIVVLLSDATRPVVSQV